MFGMLINDHADVIKQRQRIYKSSSSSYVSIATTGIDLKTHYFHLLQSSGRIIAMNSIFAFAKSFFPPQPWAYTWQLRLFQWFPAVSPPPARIRRKEKILRSAAGNRNSMAIRLSSVRKIFHAKLRAQFEWPLCLECHGSSRSH